MVRRGLLLGLVCALWVCAQRAGARADGDRDTDAEPAAHAVHRHEHRARCLTNIRALLPAGYSSARRYPVLLLLHGCCDALPLVGRQGPRRAALVPHPLIVVMPDGGSAGWYSDPCGGPPRRTETYAFDELLPWVDATFLDHRWLRGGGPEHGRVRCAQVRGAPPRRVPGGGELQRCDGRAVVRRQRLREPHPGRGVGSARDRALAGASTTRSTWPSGCAA